ncbi:Hpt domain-containing protein [Tepidimonas taiwanensis]|uniref:TMAO reductase sytem sensor TorS n=1 Tax=Tepidimonas taiwanensis TaxID=307486 RepID=A0A554X3H4_9BURK|nr:Hpt domain-containing protein [Tepidimonas taiwanensis]MCX7692952.1 Hpt domain-containing protein [Tepidimonas taiwanensis]MDM7462668.1 Hpt domain-containing protein [Tepidimonas taiwanensis]TSE30387.1 TMAO reductase sytem sensor TorS [Tepidimonas taiwanensis]UBQ06550.1 Hpt domain-containing protein [Tepidimonas taiwanensis]
MTPLIQRDTLDELLVALGDDFRGIVRLFVEQLDTERAGLDAAWAARDWPRLMRAAHSLKGSSGNMAAVALSEAAARLERAAREQNAVAAEAALADVTRLVPETVRALVAGRYT